MQRQWHIKDGILVTFGKLSINLAHFGCLEERYFGIILQPGDVCVQILNADECNHGEVAELRNAIEDEWRRLRDNRTS